MDRFHSAAYCSICSRVSGVTRTVRGAAAPRLLVLVIANLSRVCPIGGLYQPSGAAPKHGKLSVVVAHWLIVEVVGAVPVVLSSGHEVELGLR